MDDMARRHGGEMMMPSNALAKVEVIAFKDGSMTVLGHPNEQVHVDLLKAGLEMLGYDTSEVVERPMGEESPSYEVTSLMTHSSAAES